MSQTANQSAQLFAAFLSTKRVLIVDPSSASRSGIAKLIVGLGAKSNHLTILNDFPDAREEIWGKRPEVIISEYALPTGTGLDLSQETRAYPNQNNKIFVLVTSNSSQSLVAQAAEEDVDVFILKPYTIKSFSESIIKAALSKIYPSEYLKTIEDGKKLLSESKTDEAIALFDRARTLNPAPSLALFYRGQGELFRRMIENAEGNYSDGLKFNEIHYKCLTGLFDLLMEQKRLVDAYTVVKKLAKVFPANPRRMSQVLTLAVQTGNLADIEAYYALFQAAEVRNDEMVKCISAAMVVSARHFFRLGDVERAKDFLRKAAVSCAGRPNILREIVNTFVEQNLLTDARTTLERFPPASRNELHYAVARFLIQNGEEADPARLVGVLNQLIRDSMQDPTLYYWLIRHLKTLGKTDEAENHMHDASRKWPGSAPLFQKAYGN